MRKSNRAMLSWVKSYLLFRAAELARAEFGPQVEHPED